MPDRPLIVVHCQSDSLVDFTLGYALYRRVPSSHKTFWALPDCQHARGLTRQHPENHSTLLSLLAPERPN